VVVDAEKKENEREKLFQVKRKKCAQKEFDRADIVRDVRLRLPAQLVGCLILFGSNSPVQRKDHINLRLHFNPLAIE